MGGTWKASEKETWDEVFTCEGGCGSVTFDGAFFVGGSSHARGGSNDIPAHAPLRTLASLDNAASISYELIGTVHATGCLPDTGGLSATDKRPRLPRRTENSELWAMQ